MFSFSDDELIAQVKEFCHYLFECCDIEKSLEYCTDDIHYYNSLGAVDFVGKKNLYLFFVERQRELKTAHQVIYRKYSIQRITDEFAIVHLLAELKDKFLVNSSISLTKKNSQILICNINGFITVVNSENSQNSQNSHTGVLKSFFQHLDQWKEDSKNLIMKYIINVTKDSVITSYHANKQERNVYDTLTVKEFIKKISWKFVSSEAKKTMQTTYALANLQEKFNNDEFNFVLLLPYINYEGKFLWIRSYNTLYQDPISQDILCFTMVYDITEELLKLKFSEFHLYSQIDFFIHLNMKNNFYSLYPCSFPEDVTEYLNLSHDFNHDLNILIDNYVVKEDRERIKKEFNFSTIIKKIRKKNFYSISCKIKSSLNNSEIRYKQIHFFKFSKVPNVVNIACTDMTELYAEEKKKNEVLTQALEATQNANYAKSHFLASMSHDLRTPMNAILGMTQLAMEDLTNQEQVKESFDIIKQSSEHLLSLLNDVLEMNKIENGLLKNESEVFSPIDEAKQVINLFSANFSAKNLLFTFDCQQVKHTAVIGDKNKFSRIIGNILSNAVKYTPVGGSIAFVMTESRDKHSSLISLFRLSIKDTGIGILKANIPHIFEPFHREEDCISYKIEGLGLGLAIVKAFVENLGGTIAVESEVGKGTEFIVEIPYQLYEAQQSEFVKKEITTKEINLKNFSVLLVEDNPVNVLMFQKLLEKCGAKVTVAPNGKKAYESFLNMDEANPFNLVFMDIQMPIMNGYEAAKKIRDLPNKWAKEIPIIAATANAFQDDIKRSFDAGMNGHIAKPINLEELFQVLSDLKIIRQQ